MNEELDTELEAVTVRFPAYQRRILTDISEKSGLSVADILRQLAFGGTMSQAMIRDEIDKRLKP